MGFGDELINLGDMAVPEGLRPADFPTQAIRTADAIASAVQRLSGALMRGGYLYFSPGRYLVGRPSAAVGSSITVLSEEFADLVIPPWVTLWFAPNAFLEPVAWPEGTNLRGGVDLSAAERSSVRIEIQGDILSPGRRRIFAEPRAASQDGLGVGRILLTGNRIREVYPEWWGANAQAVVPDGIARPGQVGLETRNRVGVQAAIDAAVGGRVTPARAPDGSIEPARDGVQRWNRRPSIPVVMMGVYYVDGPIDIGLAENTAAPAAGVAQPPLGGFELLGERGAGDSSSGRPTLQAFANFPFGHRALLAIRGPQGFRIEGITLNANFRCDAALEIMPIDGDYAASTVEACSVSAGRRVCANLDAERLRRSSRPGRSVSQPITDFWNISFTRCSFQFGTLTDVLDAIAAPPPGRLPIPREGELVLMDLRLGDCQGLDLRGCWFRGAASPGIRCLSGRFSMNNCLSHLTRPPQVTLGADGLPVYTVDSPAWQRPDFSHGADIYLEAEANPTLGAGVRPLIPGSCTVRELQSHSWQLLGTRPIPAARRSAAKPGAVVLLNIKQACEWEQPLTWRGRRFHTVGATEYDPPSVYWCDDGPKTIGTTLVMVGNHTHGGTQIVAPTLAEFERKWAAGNDTVTRPPAPNLLPQNVRVGNGANLGPIYNLGLHLDVDASDVTGSGPVRGLRDAVMPLAGSVMATVSNVRQLRRSEVR